MLMETRHGTRQCEVRGPCAWKGPNRRHLKYLNTCQKQAALLFKFLAETEGIDRSWRDFRDRWLVERVRCVVHLWLCVYIIRRQLSSSPLSRRSVLLPPPAGRLTPVLLLKNSNSQGPLIINSQSKFSMAMAPVAAQSLFMCYTAQAVVLLHLLHLEKRNKIDRHHGQRKRSSLC